MTAIPPWLQSVLLLILGTLIGAIATYRASYTLELRKWRASAAISRKDAFYTPIYDELAAKLETLADFTFWVRASSMAHYHLTEWEKRKDTSAALHLPQRLVQSLNELVDIGERYSETRATFYEAAHPAFPNTHEGEQDFTIASLLSDKMLALDAQPDSVVIDCVLTQRPTSRTIRGYWTDEKLVEARATLIGLPSWKPLKEAHDRHVTAIHNVRADLRRRILKIVSAYQSAPKTM